MRVVRLRRMKKKVLRTEFSRGWELIPKLEMEEFRTGRTLA